MSGVNIGSVKGYFFLDVWVMANIIQLSTTEFCRRFLTKDNDPCGRMYDQMTMAARSVTANIAEGLSRHQTSRETEMKLTDVARASLSELLGDYLFFSMSNGIEVWSIHSQASTALAATRLDRPAYTDDWQREACLHIMSQKSKFDPWVCHARRDVSVNSLIQLCERTAVMLEKLLKSQLQQFKEEGGFTENLTTERLSTLHSRPDTPKCPICGKPMVRRMAKKGINKGNEFWSCSGYPDCRGLVPI